MSSSTTGNNLPNTNRIVHLYKNSDSSNSSWRKSLSTLLNQYGANSPYTLVPKPSDTFNDFDVSSDVHLLMSEETPEIKTSNTYKLPLAEIFNSKKSSEDSSSSSSLLGSISSAVKKVTTIATAAGALATSISNSASGNEGTVTSSTFAPWVAQIPSYDPKEINGLEFRYTFKFSIGQYGLWNAKEEVVKPILNLITPTLPQHINAFSVNGPYPNEFGLLSDMIVNNVTSLFSGSNSEETTVQDETGASTAGTSSSGNFIVDLGSSLEKVGRVLEGVISKAYNNYTYTLEFGNFLTLNHVIIKNSTTKFSSRVDQHGWPVAGSCTLDFKTITPFALSASSDVSFTARFGGQQ